MSIVYPEESKSISSDFRKNYWGSLFGPSEALALLEFAESNQGFVLYIARDIKHYDEINKSLAFFNKSIEILSFASWEVLAFDHFSPHPDIVSSRLSALAKLSSRDSGIIVTTIEALSQRICPKGYIDKYSLSLKNNQYLEVDSFTANLIKIGYRRVTTVMEQGEFSLKGALIDMYPMGAKNPFRIDLFDNEIESIRSFDPSSQRSIEIIKEIQLLPAREFASDKDSIDIFKKNYLSEFGNTDGFIYTEVSEGRYPGGIEFYLPLFFETTDTLFDFIPDNSVIAYQKGLDESIEQQSEELLERFNYCQNSLERLPLEVDKVFLNTNDFFAALNKKKQVQIQTSKTLKAEGLDFKSSILPPVKIEAETKRPLNKLFSFIKSFTGRTLIVCESEGRQSVLNDLLSSYELKAEECLNWSDFLNQNSKLSITHATLSEGVIFSNNCYFFENNSFT